MKTLREQVREDFDKLKFNKGAKNMAFEIMGISDNYFRQLLRYADTPEDKLLKMHKAIKKSADESARKMTKVANNIKVIEPKTVTK